jgi:hypothetical protein
VYKKGKENKEVEEKVLSFRQKFNLESKMPYKRNIYLETMKQIANEYKEIRSKAAKARKEREANERKTKEEAAKNKPIEVKPNILIVKNNLKPITIEKVVKPIADSKSKCDPITIMKPKETPELIPIVEPVLFKKQFQLLKLKRKQLPKLKRNRL